LRGIQNHGQGNDRLVLLAISTAEGKKMKFMSIQNVTENNFIRIKRFWGFRLRAGLSLGEN
jgi:hypothetical protein